jgi:hypothetical protein
VEFDLVDELPWLFVVWLLMPVGVEKFRVLRIDAELGGVAPVAEFVLE